MPKIVIENNVSDKTIDQEEPVVLSERDAQLWLELLNNPPRANTRLIAAAKMLH